MIEAVARDVLVGPVDLNGMWICFPFIPLIFLGDFPEVNCRCHFARQGNDVATFDAVGKSIYLPSKISISVGVVSPLFLLKVLDNLFSCEPLPGGSFLAECEVGLAIVEELLFQLSLFARPNDPNGHFEVVGIGCNQVYSLVHALPTLEVFNHNSRPSYHGFATTVERDIIGNINRGKTSKSQ